MPINQQNFINVLFIERYSIERILEKFPEYKETEHWLDKNIIISSITTLINKWILELSDEGFILSKDKRTDFSIDINEFFRSCLLRDSYLIWYFEFLEIYAHLVLIRTPLKERKKLLREALARTRTSIINRELNKNLSIPQDVFDNPIVFFDFFKTIFRLQKDDPKKYWCISELVLLAIERTEWYLVNNVDNYRSWERFTYKDMCIWEPYMLDPKKTNPNLKLTITEKEESNETES